MLDVVAGSRALAAVGRQARVAAGRRELQCGIVLLLHRAARPPCSSVL